MSKSPIQRILAAVDLSPCSKSALAFACALAGTCDATVQVLFVRTEQTVPSDADLAEVARALHTFVTQTPGAREAKLSERVESGDAREQIVAIAGAGEFDAIVLGTHGRTGRPRSLAGSVAESVVRTASCPVITVREPA